MNEQNMKRLYRSQKEARVAGVCAGVGEYFGLDPVFVRLMWVVVTCFTGFVPGTVAYLVAWLVMPAEPEVHPAPRTSEHPVAHPADQAHDTPA